METGRRSWCQACSAAIEKTFPDPPPTEGTLHLSEIDCGGLLFTLYRALESGGFEDEEGRSWAKNMCDRVRDLREALRA